MADQTWPVSLPEYVDRGSFSYSLSSSSLSTTMSTGYDKRRKKFTGQYATYQVSMQMTQTQADTFEQFFMNNLGYGVVLFNFPDPFFITSTIEVRIKAGKDEVPYSFSPYGESEDVTLSMNLERLITGYTPVTVTEWPTTLPQCPQHSSYNNEMQSGIIRDSNYNQGIVSVRRRFTAVTRKHSLSFIMTRAELETFFNFYASLGYGSLAFTAPLPIEDGLTMKARFDTTNGFGYTVNYYNETDLFDVKFIWEELPLIKGYE